MFWMHFCIAFVATALTIINQAVGICDYTATGLRDAVETTM